MAMISLGRFGDRRLEKGGLPARAAGLGGGARHSGASFGRGPGGRDPAHPFSAQSQRDATGDGGLRGRAPGGGAAPIVMFWRSRTPRGEVGGRGRALSSRLPGGRRGRRAIRGLAHAQFLKREEGRKAQRRDLPTWQKESQRWLDGADAAARACAQARQLTLISDREADIYAAFARRPAGAQMVVRAAQDRSLEDGLRLFAAIDALPEAGRVKLDLPAKPGRRRAKRHWRRGFRASR